jgi:hypothetical protein
MKRLLAVLTCLALTACTRSPVPITAKEGSKPDARLHGQWQFVLTDEDAPETIVIERDDNGELIVSGEAPGRGREDDYFHVIVARIGKHHYASVYTVAPPNEEAYPPSFMLLRYELRDADYFAVYGADEDLLMDAINRKLIAGAPYEDRHLPGIEVSASPDELRAFIKAHGARIFTAGPVEFTRVKNNAVPGGGVRETTPARP